MLSTGSLDKRITLYCLIAVLFVSLAGLSIGTPKALAATDVGYRDHSFAANAVANPTGEKPQSKLWFNDGIWWASMFDKTAEEFHIYRYDRAAHTWSDTGTLIDERNSSKADTLWDGTHLYVATAGVQATNANHGARILRYSYDAATRKYTRDTGFPVNITAGGLETIVLDKDTTGKLWVTYAQNSTFSDDGNLPRQVYVNHAQGDDQTWGTPFALPVTGAGNLTSDDISAVVAFDSQIGVMWSNQIDDAVYFATHEDGDPDDVWQSSRTAIQGPKYADDHISVRSLQATDSSGRVFAAVKTSLNDVSNPNPNAPLTMLAVRDRDGNWTNHTFGRVEDNHTRPIVMLDEEHRDLYMFATSPCCNGGSIYYKKTSLNNISFSDGLGEPFIQSTSNVNINDATSTKQNVNSARGLMVMASSGTSGYYWHNEISFSSSDTTAPETNIDSGPSGTVNHDSATFAFSSSEANSTFECSVDGAAFGACSSPQGYSSLADGPHTFSVRATDAAGNTDASPDSHTWTVDTDSTAPDSTASAKNVDGTDYLSGDWTRQNVAVSLNATDTGGSGVEQLVYSASGAQEILTTTVSAASLPASVAIDTEGTTTISFHAVDNAGNVESPEETFTVKIDKTAPGTPVMTSPADGSYDADGGVTVSGTAEPGSTVELFDGTASKGTVQADGSGSWSTALGGVGEGSHSYTAKATDAAGNVSAASDASTVMVDTTAPNTTIDTKPASLSNDASPGFTFSSSEANSTLQCKLDGGGFVACASPRTLTGLADGPHTFSVRATDAAGNTDASPDSHTWTVDTVAPTVAGLTPAGGATNVAVGSSVEATFSEGVDQATLNQGTFTLVRQGTTTPVTATVSYDAQARRAVLKPAAALAEGMTYTVTIKGGANGVKDAAGNPLQSDKTWNFSTTVVTAPGNLSATRVGGGTKQRVDLRWVDNSRVETKFVIQRSTASNFGGNLVTYEAPANATSYSNTAVQPNKQYYYRVFAVNSAGVRSAASNVALVTTAK